MQPRRVVLAVLAMVIVAGPVRAQAPQAGAPPAAPKLTRPPRLKAPVSPVYPQGALAQGLSADVTLQIDIDATGAVTAVEVVGPAGHGFDEAAREAALQMQFEPAEIDGAPGPIRIEYVQRFRPAVPAPPPPPPPPPAAEPPTVTLVRGRLRERGTRDPIAGADVSLSASEEPGHLVANTDGEGRFEVTGVPGGKARLVVASGEHEPCVRDLELPAAGAPPLEVVCLVSRRRGAVYETVVSAPSEGQQVTRHAVSQPEMTTVPGTFGDPLRVIQTLPGVARSPYGLGLLIIRGSSPQDSGVYVDGHRVPLLYHFLGGPSVLTPDLLERIEFYPGGFGVRYGRATAGVVDVTTRTEAVKNVHGSADVDFLDSSAYVEGPLGDHTSGGIAARRSYVDTLLPFFIAESEGSSTAVVTPVYWDYQARVTRTLANGRLSLFAFGSDDSLKVIAADPERGDLELGTRIGFHRVIATWAATLGGWTSVLSPSYGYDLVTFSAGAVSVDGSAHVLDLRHDLSRPVAPWLKIATGLDAEVRFDHFALDVPLPPERRTYGQTERTDTNLERNQSNMAVGAFLEGYVDPHPALRLVPGLRLDWFRAAGEDRVSLDPRLVARWTRSPTQAFKIGAGIFHQAPSSQELDRQFGNPDLPLLWADQYHVGIEQGLTRALSLDATVYYLRRHSLPIGSSGVGEGGRLSVYVPEGKGRSYGLEMRLRHAVTAQFYGWISYTLARSETILTRSGTEYRPTDFDQTHNLILVASRRLGGWELGTRFRLVSGVPETPIEGGVYDSDFNGWRPVQGEPGSARRQMFHQLDLRAEYTFTFDAWRLSAYLDVQNVYNAENPEATLYDYRFRESAPLRGLPVLPILGLRGRF